MSRDDHSERAVEKKKTEEGGKAFLGDRYVF
jgi:hypothetical protein